ncbi:MAG: glycosyltransferase [archaeon]
MTLIILARDYPNPGGRMTFVKQLIRMNPDYLILSRQCSKHNVRHIKCITNALFEYHLRTFFELIKIPGEKIIFGTGLSALGGVIYSKLFRTKVIYNLSGLRGGTAHTELMQKHKKGIFPIRKAYRLLTDYLSLSLSDKIVVPTDYAKKSLVSKYKKFSDKIVVINEGADISDAKKLKINNAILFYKTDYKLFSLVKESLARIHPNISLIYIVPNKQIELHHKKQVKILKASLPTVIRSSKLFVGLPEIEYHSTTILEALKLKVPMILSDAGWIREEFASFPEILISEPTSQNIIKRIEDFLANPTIIAIKSREASKILCRKYDIEKSLKQVSSLFS